MKPPTAAIVDGYSTGNFLPSEFERLGWRVVHVQSTPELNPSTMIPELSQYADNVVCPSEGALADCVQQLSALGVRAVLAGQEPGVPLADRLSELLGLATNGSALSTSRRDKFAMIEAVRQADGLLTARQFKTGSPAQARAWAEANGYPVVVKPLASASTDNVTICADGTMAEEATAAVLRSTNIYDQPNAEVLVQSYLDGDEYIVDTVSANGTPHVCGVWLYDKRLLPTGQNIYNRDILLAPDDGAVRSVVAYATRVLGALGIAHGPAHIEIKLTSRGPALVELGARLNGDMHPSFHEVCLGTNQAALTALAYADPQHFVERHGHTSYARKQPALVYNAPTGLSGTVRQVDAEVVDQINRLPSVHALSVKLQPGQRISPTTNLLTSPLRVFMTNIDPNHLQHDYEEVQQLKDAVYLL